ASSADGTGRGAAEYGTYGGLGPGYIYATTNSGSDWTLGGNSQGFWRAVAASADGRKTVAVASANTSYGGPRALICTSADFGANWTSNNAPDRFWTAVASSADGTRLTAAESYHELAPLFSSVDSGVTWSMTAAPAEEWSSIACSADGIKWFAS